jgi:HPt (histidine-containing phosphotransfer) domain-containing protein
MTSLLPQSDRIYLDTELALSQIGDVQAMQGMLTMLEESLGRDIPKIAELLDAGDVVGANRVLHPLKGFIPIFCVPALCELVAQVEMLSKDSKSTAIGPAYAELQPELQQLLAEVSSYLNDNGASL